MDIKRDEAFEEAYAEICKPIVRRPYPRNQNGEYVYKEIHEAHLMWQQAKKVAVPDTYTTVVLALESVQAEVSRSSFVTMDADNESEIYAVDANKLSKYIDDLIEAQEN